MKLVGDSFGRKKTLWEPIATQDGGGRFKRMWQRHVHKGSLGETKEKCNC